LHFSDPYSIVTSVVLEEYMPTKPEKKTYVALKGPDGKSVSLTVYDIDPDQLGRRIEKACSDKPVRRVRRSEPVVPA
jgi:hypothetical protein